MLSLPSFLGTGTKGMHHQAWLSLSELWGAK